MAKWMVVKDQDEDDHNTRSTANLSSHVNSNGKNKVQAEGINVYVGDTGGIGSASVNTIGVMADMDDVDDPQLSPQLAAALTAESIAAGGGNDPNSSDDTAGTARSGNNVTCGSVPAYPSDTYQLSPNFTLGMLSSKAVFPHRIAAQNGFSVNALVCNLKALAVNILEPLRTAHPGFKINSGFRRGSGSSKHNMGCAVDVQWPGLAAANYMTKARYVRDHLPFDAIILEHGKSIWLHLQYQRGLSKQRGIVQTMYRGQYSSGLKVYY